MNDQHNLKGEAGGMPEPVRVNPADPKDTRRVIPSAHRGLTHQVSMNNAALQRRREQLAALGIR